MLGRWNAGTHREQGWDVGMLDVGIGIGTFGPTFGSCVFWNPTCFSKFEGTSSKN